MKDGIEILKTLIHWMRKNKKDACFRISVGEEGYQLMEDDVKSLEKILVTAESIEFIKDELKDALSFLK